MNHPFMLGLRRRDTALPLLAMRTSLPGLISSGKPKGAQQDQRKKIGFVPWKNCDLKREEIDVASA
ncbi:MAG: hypothetical protein WBW33_20085 [Bryobacteraceae bacterium]